jgi:hypothetical protein
VASLSELNDRSEADEEERSRKKQWSDFSPAARVVIVVGALVELVVTMFALRDLIRRPRAQVRGPKVLWFLGCFVQPIGSPLYLVAGRRRGSEERDR